LAASAIAVGILASALPIQVSGAFLSVLEGFASPGEFLRWASFGGAFSGYPTSLAGYMVWIGATSLFWFVGMALMLSLLRKLLHVRAWPDN
jgi:hypothetical protein